MDLHQHQWATVQLVTPKGTQAGRQCACGMQTIGGLNAGLVVAAMRFNLALGDGLRKLAGGGQ